MEEMIVIFDKNENPEMKLRLCERKMKVRLR
jgi:hypothetical protein